MCLSIEYHDSFYQKHNEDQEFCDKTNKICYPTKTQAKKQRKDLELKYQTYYSVYCCPHCDKWHLTTVDSKHDR